jgi:hypothetical protein
MEDCVVPGQVLALQIGPWHDFDNGVVSTGYRVILTVRRIIMEVQHTVFFGLNLFQPTYSPWSTGQVDIGSLSVPVLFSNFLKEFYGKRSRWAQFVDPPYNPSFYLTRTYVLVPPPPEPPSSEGEMELLHSGYDPLQGYFCKFKGNFRLCIPIFQDFQGVTNLTPDYSIKVK